MSLANFVTKISPFGTGFIACKGAKASWAEVAPDVAKFTQVASFPDSWFTLHWEAKSGLEWSRKFRVVGYDIYWYEDKQPVYHKCETCSGTGTVETQEISPIPHTVERQCPDCDGEGQR